MTEFIPAFVLTVLGVTEGAWQNPARMVLVVRRPYAHLEDRLRRAFEGRGDVEVVPDRRRRGERRVSARTVQTERRRAERRTSKEEILEVVIHGDPLTLFR